MKSNIKIVLSNIVSKLEQIKQNKSAYLRVAALTQLGLMQTRIHEQGKAADGGDIGKYSTTPIYVSAENNAGKSFGRPIGKTGRSKFEGGKKAGQDHKSRYFERGYDEYKSAIGRNIGKVNLSLSGQLNKQLTIIDAGDRVGLGWEDNEKRERAGHLENKYRKIWGQTEDEKKQVVQATQEFINEFLNQ